MSIALYRIDDRLIHGQVVVGWGKPLNVGFIVLVDDAVRASAWEQELYRMGVPADIEVVFASTEEALRSEEHTSELQSQSNLVCRLLLEKKKKKKRMNGTTTKSPHNAVHSSHIS